MLENYVKILCNLVSHNFNFITPGVADSKFEYRFEQSAKVDFFKKIWQNDVSIKITKRKTRKFLRRGRLALHNVKILNGTDSLIIQHHNLSKTYCPRPSKFFACLSLLKFYEISRTIVFLTLINFFQTQKLIKDNNRLQVNPGRILVNNLLL